MTHTHVDTHFSPGEMVLVHVQVGQSYASARFTGPTGAVALYTPTIDDLRALHAGLGRALDRIDSEHTFGSEMVDLAPEPAEDEAEQPVGAW